MIGRRLCAVGVHAWRDAPEMPVGPRLYQQCARCGARQAVVLHRGYAPVDAQWLEGGPPSRAPLSIPKPSPAVQPPPMMRRSEF